MSRSDDALSAATGSGGGRTSAMVDWDLAVTIGSRLVGEGPKVSRAEAAEAVTELREGADRSTALVRDFTGLQATERSAPVLVIDRPGWIQANADAFSQIITPLAARLQERKGGAPGPIADAIGSRVTGAEVGAMLGFLGSKVLGQFDPFHDQPGEQGRLLLVAPNIVHVERELGVDPHDFRLWVCLHEETHRVQFTAVPWMTDHLRGEMEKILSTVRTDVGDLLGDVVKALGEQRRGERELSLLDVFATPEQRELVDRVTGVMSLLEGHADVVMDGVGPEVIPSVAEIRRRFTQRRKGVGPLDRVLRRLLGLDQKMAQYRDGAVFVRGVVDQVGMEGFNAVWTSPEQLPSKAEIHDPAAWVARVHGVSTTDPVLLVRAAVAAGRPGGTALVACSGGADSLALLAGTVTASRFERVVGVVVDHGLQQDSAGHTARVVDQMAGLGASETASIRVTVDPGPQGVEAGAREARYAALAQLAAHFAAEVVLLGHTRDDQAETVLLGLARGSGGRSLAGMRRGFVRDATSFERPLIDLGRAQTEAACTAQGISWWEDPHNADRRFLRAAVRHDALPVLEDVLGPGVAAALARTAESVREDVDALDALADALLAQVGSPSGLACGPLADAAPALRHRVVRLAALAAGALPGELSRAHVLAVASLVTSTDGDPRLIRLPGHVTARRAGAHLDFLPTS